MHRTARGLRTQQKVFQSHLVLSTDDSVCFVSILNISVAVFLDTHQIVCLCCMKGKLGWITVKIPQLLKATRENHTAAHLMPPLFSGFQTQLGSQLCPPILLRKHCLQSSADVLSHFSILHRVITLWPD